MRLAARAEIARSTRNASRLDGCALFGGIDTMTSAVCYGTGRPEVPAIEDSLCEAKLVLPQPFFDVRVDLAEADT